MREIRFRAKTIKDGQWIEGDLFRAGTEPSDGEFDRDMSVERVYKDYYLCNNIGKFSSTTIPFAEEGDYELIKD